MMGYIVMIDMMAHQLSWSMVLTYALMLMESLLHVLMVYSLIAYYHIKMANSYYHKEDAYHWRMGMPSSDL
jgi:hypothetical protein